MRRRRVIAACLALILAGGAAAVVLASQEERYCTMMAGFEGVSVAVSDEVPGLTRAVACVRRQCRELRGEPPRRLIALRADGPDEVDVVLTLDRGAAATRVMTTRVRLRRDEPNGPGCGTWWNAAAMFHEGRFEQVFLPRR